VEKRVQLPVEIWREPGYLVTILTLKGHVSTIKDARCLLFGAISANDPSQGGVITLIILNGILFANAHGIVGTLFHDPLQRLPEVATKPRLLLATMSQSGRQFLL